MGYFEIREDVKYIEKERKKTIEERLLILEKRVEILEKINRKK